jgi:replicative DNA helicase
LIILAGRPGMGKTALATNIGYNIARPGAVR